MTEVGDRRLPARFWAKVHVEPMTGCWLWAGATCHGHGVMHWHRSTRYAHVVAWTELIGPVPPGLELDHVRARGCAARACVNPAHLEPVTRLENVRRGNGGSNNRQKSTCPRGHTYDNVRTESHGWRHRKCRTCSAAYSRAYRARKKEVA